MTRQIPLSVLLLLASGGVGVLLGWAEKKGREKK